MYTQHFFIYSPIDGQLGCFHILATVNNADKILKWKFSP